VPVFSIIETAEATEVFFNGAEKEILMDGVMDVLIYSVALLKPSTLTVFTISFAGGVLPVPEDFLSQLIKAVFINK
jgi:hypothetical protein